ncbi:MAG TPA: hypothetical protein PLC28_20810 [Spirochaetota bacterium]|nr:hypothetical protein [Spirochaetota bacterium]HPC43261.1 hypothetical protein [Spirochaetota bacterium]HPL17966.1 hypothetical protein [Spirochaetota bacterium]HQJ73157.1 hypothetical protein [Spirochaetota bacterium]HRS79284.1 hypothetical protein [Spirochaetota bacterium]
MEKINIHLIVVLMIFSLISGCKDSTGDNIKKTPFSFTFPDDGYNYLMMSNERDRFITFNNKLYIDGYSDPWHNVLWEYDGFNPPSVAIDFGTWDSDDGRHFYLEKMAVFQGKLYFIKNYKDAGIEMQRELWVFDGTNQPALIMNGIEDIFSRYGAGGRNLFVFNEKLYFTSAPDCDQWKLWVYDGLNPPRVAVENLFNGKTVYRGASNFIIFKDKLYYIADVASYGGELWVYDGVNNPAMVSDIFPRRKGIAPYPMIVYKEKLYFIADDGKHGPELWVYDGSNTPTMVADINKIDDNGSVPCFLTVYKDKLFFAANDGLHGTDLWSYDGMNTPELFYDFNNSVSYDEYFTMYDGPMYMTVVNDKLYLTSEESFESLTLRELWVYDGINPLTIAPNNDNLIYEFITFNGKIYFYNIDGFWSYDGMNNPNNVTSANLVLKINWY